MTPREECHRAYVDHTQEADNAVDSTFCSEVVEIHVLLELTPFEKLLGSEEASDDEPSAAALEEAKHAKRDTCAGKL